jgi:glutamate 5-kinase
MTKPLHTVPASSYLYRAIGRMSRLGIRHLAVTGADGSFTSGDPVDLVDEHGRAVARGLVNFDAAELPPLLGRRTRELASEYGPSFSREVVHRDDLVLLHPPAWRWPGPRSTPATRR